ncbi:MAG: efflux RND transporter periplasmic adaptor subunit, partial [Bacteroidota bacterium]
AGWFLGGRFSGKAQVATQEQQAHQHEHQSGEIWTCSMHPQIRQETPGDCPLCGMELTVMSNDNNSDPTILEMTPAAAKLANIQTTIVGASNVDSEQTLRLTGKVQTDERLASSQVAHLPGRIEQLYVTFTGAPVKVGQTIAELYSPELITAQRALIEAVKLKEINAGLLEAARNKLRYWKISETLIKEVETKGIIQEVFPIYADASGIVTQLKVAVGDHLMQGEPLFDLVDLSRVWVVFDAYESDLANIRLGDRIQFKTPALPNQDFQAKISFIDPVVNPQTRVVTLRTEVSNFRGLLKPEMLVSGDLKQSRTKTASLTIPKSAVLWTGKRSVVYEKIPDAAVPSFRFKAVELGGTIGDHYEVISGLEAGAEVVTQGGFTIDAAAQLNNQASMMNQEVRFKGAVEEKKVSLDYQAQASLAFRIQLEALLIQYLLLKDALVATDSKKAPEMATNFIEVLKDFKKPALEAEALAFWSEQREALESHGSLLVAARSIEEQRQQFEFVSMVMIKTIKAFGVAKETYYIQHCPMAFDDKGADWISNVQEIRNPYFGDVMLKCGFVEETLNEE